MCGSVLFRVFLRIGRLFLYDAVLSMQLVFGLPVMTSPAGTSTEYHPQHFVFEIVQGPSGPPDLNIHILEFF